MALTLSSIVIDLVVLSVIILFQDVFKHGWLLIKMSVFAAGKLKFK